MDTCYYFLSVIFSHHSSFFSIFFFFSHYISGSYLQFVINNGTKVSNLFLSHPQLGHAFSPSHAPSSLPPVASFHLRELTNWSSGKAFVDFCSILIRQNFPHAQGNGKNIISSAIYRSTIKHSLTGGRRMNLKT